MARREWMLLLAPVVLAGCTFGQHAETPARQPLGRPPSVNEAMAAIARHQSPVIDGHPRLVHCTPKRSTLNCTVDYDDTCGTFAVKRGVHGVVRARPADGYCVHLGPVRAESS